MPTKVLTPNLNNTWVYVHSAKKLKAKEIVNLTIMNRELVLWKSESGSISLLDAYCTHLGAHLGNGKVCGEVLQCNFHKRKFELHGSCRGRGKSVQSYEIIIQHELIFAWFGEAESDWKMPDLLQGFYPDDTDSTWKIFKTKQFNYDFSAKDLLDNTVDPVHFKTFHAQCDSFEPTEVLEVAPHLFVSKVTFIGNPQLTKRNIKFRLVLVNQSYGPTSLVVNASAHVMGKTYISKFIFLCTPKQNENTDFTLAIATKIDKSLSWWQRLFVYAYTYRAFRIQAREFYVESEKIWKTKTYLKDPDYLPQEAAMKVYNAWYSRFFEKSSQACSKASQPDSINV